MTLSWASTQPRTTWLYPCKTTHRFTTTQPHATKLCLNDISLSYTLTTHFSATPKHYSTLLYQSDTIQQFTLLDPASTPLNWALPWQHYTSRHYASPILHMTKLCLNSVWPNFTITPHDCTVLCQYDTKRYNTIPLLYIRATIQHYCWFTRFWFSSLLPIEIVWSQVIGIIIEMDGDSRLGIVSDTR